MRRPQRMEAAKIVIAMTAVFGLFIAAIIAVPLITFTSMSAVLACGPNFGSVSQVGLGSSASGLTIPTLPEATIKYLEGRDVKKSYEQNMQRYRAAEEATGVPIAVMAALHYREGGMDPNRSIFNGAFLGTGINVDKQFVDADADKDAINAANHFIRMARAVYKVDVTKTPMTAELWGQAFLAYNRGFLYKWVDNTYDQSPYVMNGVDENHLNMRWIGPDTVRGVDGNKAGALTVMYYLANISLAPADGMCAGANGVAGDTSPPVVADKLWVSSGFDFRVRSNGVRRDHNGIDIIGGTQIVAYMAGEVTLARYYGGYGYAVIIDHGNGVQTLYGHMKENSTVVVQGQHVNAGDPLGTMGNTGDSEGDHLHFEYRENKVPVNPFPILEAAGIDLNWQAGAYPKNEKPGPQD